MRFGFSLCSKVALGLCMIAGWRQGSIYTETNLTKNDYLKLSESRIASVMWDSEARIVRGRAWYCSDRGKGSSTVVSLLQNPRRVPDSLTRESPATALVLSGLPPPTTSAPNPTSRSRASSTRRRPEPPCLGTSSIHARPTTTPHEADSASWRLVVLAVPRSRRLIMKGNEAWIISRFGFPTTARTVRYLPAPLPLSLSLSLGYLRSDRISRYSFPSRCASPRPIPGQARTPPPRSPAGRYIMCEALSLTPLLRLVRC
jgi:hypothetical protein